MTRPVCEPGTSTRRLASKPERVHGLGRFDGKDHVAVALSENVSAQALPEPLRADGLRAWFGVLDDAALAIAMRAVQVVEWDRTHQFCGACGQPTIVSGSERAKTCKGCRLTVYPRICPAMMVLITRGREVLLGRGVNFRLADTVRWPDS